MSKKTGFSLLVPLTICLVLPLIAQARSVIVATPLGDIEMELLEQDAPNTVANFLNYIENNRYDRTFIHRNAPDFIIQGGGFSFKDGKGVGIAAFPPVNNEFKVSNTRGTVAMAKLSGQPDSATSQWFINAADNSANLDAQNGGFTVFARVTSGMDVVDAINELPMVNAGGPFGELPVIDYVTGSTLLEENLVMTGISVIPKQVPFVMNAGLNDAWYNKLTDGQGFFITVFPDLNFVSLAWFTYDSELPLVDATANLGDPGHRWLTAGGPIQGDSAVMNITIASGGLFDTATEIDRTDPPGSDGVITLSFDDCSKGLVEYDIPSINRKGEIAIERVADDNIILCETLSGE